MSTAPAPTRRDDEESSASHKRRRRVVLIAAATLAVAIIVLAALLAISDASNGEVSVLIGTLGSDALAGLAVVTALAAVAVGMCAIPVARPWLLLLVPLRLAAIAATSLVAVVWVLTSPATVVPLVSARCDTGYVVREQSFLFAGWGTVYRTNGLLATRVALTSGDDGYHPFDDGAYTVQDDGASLRVWYSIASDPLAAPIPTEGAPAFTLPRLTDRISVCGVSAGVRPPLPTPSALPVFGVDDVRSGLDEMVGRTFAGAVGPIRDAAGKRFDPEAVAPEGSPCGDGGTQFAIALDFKTADNAASFTRILAIWTRAGYSSDRAMQADIRYSATLPIMTMSIRDSTTIDDLVHMRITSQCGVPG